MNDPWKEFLDEGVETEKKKLLESIADFLGTFSICVYPNGNYYVTGVHQIVGAPPEAFKEYKAKMKELNDKASDVWKSYQEFVRVARKEGMEETGEEIHVRLDKELKEAVAEILEEIGLDIPTAVRMFFTAVAREKGIPFDLKTVSDEKTDGVVTDQDG